MDHGAHIVPHKIKAEWTRSSANEVFGESAPKIIKNDKLQQEGKIKILEQIVLRRSNEDSQPITHQMKRQSAKSKKVINSRKTEEGKSKKCQICEKSFLQANFEDHLQSHSFFECQEKDCFKKFKRKSSLRKHMYFHSGKFKYSCEDCKETFIDKCKYQVHIASKHKKIDRVYECKECEKTFTSADYLRKHQIMHKDEFPYPCTVCNQKFKWLTSLQTHNMIHTQNKTIVQCKECLKRFFNQRTLDRHMKIHQDIKYQCNLCKSVVSSRKDNIMRHIRHLHTEIPRNEISCHILEDKSNRKSKIENDEIEVTDEDDYTIELIIDETAREEPEQEIVEEIQKPINNRVNVIQSIGNPNKNQQQAPQSSTLSIEKSVEYNETEKSITTQHMNDSSNQTQTVKPDKEIQLPPKKKAIAKYNPIEHYRKILGLSETNTSTSSNQNEESSEPVFPDHWRKRTSQNYLFRR